jgi:hypothetical protein
VDNAILLSGTRTLFLHASTHQEEETRAGSTLVAAEQSSVIRSENEATAHLFFSCVVARHAWSLISEVFHIQIGIDYESLAKHWLCDKKFGTINVGKF